MDKLQKYKFWRFLAQGYGINENEKFCDFYKEVVREKMRLSAEI